MHKQIVFGDIHGRQIWKRIVEKESDANEVIFLGDYVDSLNVDPLTQLNNLREIIDFKVADPSWVKLLIGNHDFHYMKAAVGATYSGFQAAMFQSFNYEYEQMRYLFQVTYLDRYGKLFSHAGVTETWLNNVQISSTDPKVISDSINELFKYKPQAFSFSYEDKSGYGEHRSQSPIWVRQKSLYVDKIKPFMVIGHTQVGQPITLAKARRQGFLCIDCLENGFYLSIENGIINIKRLEP